MWLRTNKFDRDGVRLLRTHYSRRKPDSPQFMPPGETLVLITPCRRAVWGWWRPHPRSGLRSRNGHDGWTCSVFHNDGAGLSSALILAAEIELVRATDDGTLTAPCGPSGMLTYVWRARVRSANPGYCYRCAGWSRVGISADKRKDLWQKPIALAGVCRQ